MTTHKKATAALREKILVVDDEEDGCEVLAQLLSDEGYVVEKASNGFEALMILARFPADLVLTDNHMPGMTGVELIDEIRQRQPGQPVLLMTGDVKRDAPGRGIAECLLKPVDPTSLVWSIEYALACQQPRVAPDLPPTA